MSLDALTHYHKAPEMVIEDTSVNANIPSIAMEEAIPEAVAGANMASAPEEVYKAKNKAKELRTEAEMTKRDRKKRRAAIKRIFKKKHGNLQKDNFSTKKIKIVENVSKSNRFKNLKSVINAIEEEKTMRKKPINSKTSSAAVKL